MKFKLLFVLFLLSSYCFADTLSDLPIQTIAGNQYYVYVVGKKETIYGICKKLNISKDEITKVNPKVADGIKQGEKIYIPVVKNDNVAAEAAATEIPEEFHHIVKKGETLYGLSRMYNISQEEIIRCNPSAEQGLKAGQSIVIPQNREESITDVNTANNSSLLFHTIKSGDTLFNVAKRYNTTIENILMLNPGVSPTNFKIGDVVRIKPDTKVDDTDKTDEHPQFISHTVKKGEDIYDIANQYNVSADEIMNANPNVGKIKKNTILTVPIIPQQPEIPTDAEPVLSEITEIYDSIQANSLSDTINIALMLPFKLDESTPSKQATLYTEYYKGFLIAVDSVMKESDKHINIYAYDTGNSLENVKKILADTVMNSMDIIFGPDDINQMETICSFARTKDIAVVNSFIVKNGFYDSYENFYQINIPHSYMYDNVYEEFTRLFNDRRTIFISLKGTEEKDIIMGLKRQLNEKGIVYSEYTIDENLQPELLDSITSTAEKYVIVPTSSSRTMLTRITVAYKRIKENRQDLDMSIFGYPEWVTYLKDYRDFFKSSDTYVYSRFFVDTEADNYLDFLHKYVGWYGEDMTNAVPKFGVLGFDMGYCFLKQMTTTGIKQPFKYKGIQTEINFVRVSNWGGFINNAVSMIHFTPAYITLIEK